MTNGEMIALTVLVGVLLFGSDARAQTVVDGDTLKINGTTIRLHGIDAPEMHQTCNGWPAGPLSAAFLRSIISQRNVKCDDRGKDRYGRTIGKCWADQFDIQAEMVRAGMAWAFTRYSHEYESQEKQARAENLGIHAHGCIPAWDWRALQK